jgi:leucyl/phenylalanyl-tRNA--protein transferase
MVLLTKDFKLHRSLRKKLQSFIASADCHIQIDSAFEHVIRHCAQTPRHGQVGTWIVEDMIEAYVGLHEAGFAHSVETWIQGKLVGGLYCVSLGDTLFGESMFTHTSDASKIALAALVAFARAQGMSWIDCQQNTKHLASLGAKEMDRSCFLNLVRNTSQSVHRIWTFDPIVWKHLVPQKVTP